MGERNKNKDVDIRLCSMLENLEGTPGDELQNILKNLNPNTEAEEQHFIARLSVMQRRLAENPKAELADSEKIAVDSQAPLRGLVSEARRRGMTTEEFANLTHLSTSLVMKLDLRQIRYSSIPRHVVENVARAIKRSADQVALYLQGEPIRTAILYSDTQEGVAKEQQDFLDEVRKDGSIPEEHKAMLLNDA
jgi:hypothetical protein